MSRYIDYDAIDYRNDKMHGKSSDFIDGVIYMAQRIEEAPSIDIVRCAECNYWKESQYYQGVMVCTYVKGATFTRQHDDFCSRGERKESK